MISHVKNIFSKKKKILLLIFLILITIFKMWIWDRQPIEIIAYAGHDDFLFIKQANTILQGKWLGEFDNLTLAKGQGYSLFIALISFLQLPLILSERLLYVSLCLYASKVVSLFFQRKYRQISFIGTYLFLLFNPITYDTSLTTRANRPAIYYMIVLFTLVSLLSAIFWSWSSHARKSIFLYTSLLLASFGLGIAWITREESIFLGIGFTVVLFCVLLKATAPFSSSVWKKLVVMFSCSLLPFSLIVGAVMLMNYKWYGELILNEFLHPSFIKAYGSLTRVKPPIFYPTIPVTELARNEISQVSPLFAKLQHHIDGGTEEFWKQLTEDETPVPGTRDIAGGWFMWALRNAVLYEGYYNSLPDALNFYDNLAKEVNTACDTHQLDCFPERDTLIPPWNKEYAPALLQTTQKFADQLMFPPILFYPIPSNKDPYEQWLVCLRVLHDDPFYQPTDKLRLDLINLNIKIYYWLVPAITLICSFNTLRFVWKKKLSALTEPTMIAFLGTGVVFLGASGVVLLLTTLSFRNGLVFDYLAPAYISFYVLIVVGLAFRSSTSSTRQKRL